MPKDLGFGPLPDPAGRRPRRDRADLTVDAGPIAARDPSPPAEGGFLVASRPPRPLPHRPIEDRSHEEADSVCSCSPRLAWPAPSPAPARAADAKIVLIAGKPSHGPGRPRVQRRDQAPGQVPEGGPRRRPGLRRRRLARGRDRLRGRQGGRLLHGRRRRPPDDPGRPPRDDPAADGQGRRPRLPALRRRGPQGQGRRRVPRLARRLLRDGLLDQPALDGRDQEPARAPDHPGRQAVRDQRRVVLTTSASAPR